jgi:hypothetical protein
MGGTLSSMKIVWLHEELLPQLSVAIHVLVMVPSCGQEPAVVTSLKESVVSASQLSVADAIPVLVGSVLASHSIVTLGGHVMIGSRVSISIMICTHESLLPHASTTIQVLMIVISWTQDPSTITSLKENVGRVSQPSVAVAMPVFAGSVLAEQSMVILTGHVIKGARVSNTEMTWVHVLLLKQSSVAVQVLVIFNSCEHDPPIVMSL